MKNGATLDTLEEKIRTSVLNDDLPKLQEILETSTKTPQEKNKAINSSLEGHTPLMIAIVNNNPEMVTLLVANGADVNTGTEKIKPLDLAIEKGDVKLIRALNTNNQLDVESLNSKGVPPLQGDCMKFRFNKGVNKSINICILYW